MHSFSSDYNKSSKNDQKMEIHLEIFLDQDLTF